jgi:hypothetical protein
MKETHHVSLLFGQLTIVDTRAGCLHFFTPKTGLSHGGNYFLPALQTRITIVPLWYGHSVGLSQGQRFFGASIAFWVCAIVSRL